jgi:ABC-type transport system involved in cytochrome c biogenesis permease subunit
MTQLHRYFPAAVVGICAVFLFAFLLPEVDPEEELHLGEAGKIVVYDQGRPKPLDSFARTTLLQISNRQEWRDESGRMEPAIRWYFDVTSHADSHNSESENLPAFRIENPKLRSLLKLSDQSSTKPGDKSDKQTKYLYSFKALKPSYKLIHDGGKELAQSDPSQLSPLETEFLELATQAIFYNEVISLYESPHKVFRIENDQLLEFLLLEQRPGDYRYSLEEFSPRVPLLLREAERVRTRGEEKLKAYEKKLLELESNLNRYFAMVSNRSDTLLVVPPSGPSGEWQSYAKAGQGSDFDNVLHAYAESQKATKKDEFNKTVRKYREKQAKEMPGIAAKASFESYYNHAQPFYQCIWLYFIVFVLSCFSWLGWTEPLRRGAFWLILVTLTLHSLSLFARMYLLGRPLVFIHNLYGTAVFIGWMCAWVGLGSELIFRNGLGTAVGSFIGFATSILAHNLAAGDTLEVVVAVLDTNFWLATHVTIVNSGYAATMFAGVLGIVLIGVGVLSNGMDKPLYRVLGQMMYGVFGFAILFSFVGTVLGGIWADQSWGRFWGWDPKENGALLIVIMNALILHARWSGLVQARGMAVLAVLGNVIVLWSWFYVNMLNVGLHKYGPLESTGAWWLMSVMGSQVLIAGVGLIPMRYWRSYATLQAPERPTAPSTRPTRQEMPRGGVSTGITPA